MIVSDITARVKRIFGDEAGVQIIDSDLIAWINEIQRDIASSQSILEVSATVVVPGGTSTYTLPTDVQNLFSVWGNNSRLEPKSMREAEELLIKIGDTTAQPSGTPELFWIWANIINLWPVPASNVTLKLFYSRFPVSVAALGDTLELDVKYQNIIINYCLQKAYELDEDWQGSQFKAQQVSGDLSSLTNDEKWTVQSTYPVITVLAEDM